VHPVNSLESVMLFLSRLNTAGLGRKTLWGRDLTTRYSVFNELFLTASARAMMNEFEMRRKVRCHKSGLWKTVGGQKRAPRGLAPGHESQNSKWFGVVESHLSQRTRKMGHPAKDGAGRDISERKGWASPSLLSILEENSGDFVLALVEDLLKSCRFPSGSVLWNLIDEVLNVAQHFSVHLCAPMEKLHHVQV
jgi:hypothetical protein